MSLKTISILKRLLKGFIGGAVSSMVVIPISGAVSWVDVISILNVLALSGIIGGISGVLLAAEKALSWVDEK